MIRAGLVQQCDVQCSCLGYISPLPPTLSHSLPTMKEGRAGGGEKNNSINTTLLMGGEVLRSSIIGSPHSHNHCRKDTEIGSESCFPYFQAGSVWDMPGLLPLPKRAIWGRIQDGGRARGCH